VLELSSCFAFDEVEPEWAVLPSSQCGCSIVPPLAYHFMSCWGIAFFQMQVLTVRHSRVWLQLETSCEIVEPLHCVEPECPWRRCTAVHISWQWLLDSLSSVCVSVFVCRPDQRASSVSCRSCCRRSVCVCSWWSFKHYREINVAPE